MGWSLESVSYRMSGSGSWQHLLPDGDHRRLYAVIYPEGRPLAEIQDRWGSRLGEWEGASIVRVTQGKAVPLGPIMTDTDLDILGPWFEDTASAMAEAVREREGDFRWLSRELGGGAGVSSPTMENILTILVCALTLDSWVFSLLRQAVIGTYPPRGRAGRFFFWGYAFEKGPQRIFGFTTYGGLKGRRLHMIRSHGLDREAIKKALDRGENWDYLQAVLERKEILSFDRTETLPSEARLAERAVKTLQGVGLVDGRDPSRLAVPVFGEEDQEKISRLCGPVSRTIMGYLTKAFQDFETLLPRCSFARCSRSDVLCMLFHLAYSYAADRLVEEGVIPDFPRRAGGEWGVWIS